jgi:hypothetical protein
VVSGLAGDLLIHLDPTGDVGVVNGTWVATPDSVATSPALSEGDAPDHYDEFIHTNADNGGVHLNSDRITPVGNATPWLTNADYGVIYRRGTYVPEPEMPAPGTGALSALAAIARRRRSAPTRTAGRQLPEAPPRETGSRDPHRHQA